MRFFLAFLRRKRGIVLFVVAFMLPLFFVIAVSIDTITKRKKATYSLLESNLWLSARSALNQMESRFMDIEKEWMDTEYFDSLLADKSINQTHPGADIFIIDSDFNIVYPETLKNNNLRLLVYDKDWDPNYRKFMTRGEMNSQNSQNYSSAVKNYQKALSVAETKQQKGLAIEGMARTYLADKNYKPAIKYYQILKNEYSQTRNLSDHPYGITAPLQLYTIGKLLDKDVAGQD